MGSTQQRGGEVHLVCCIMSPMTYGKTICNWVQTLATGLSGLYLLCMLPKGTASI